VPVPQGGIEFDVEDIEAAAEELRAKGYRLLHGPRIEPWGQTVARLLSPEGLLVGLSITPWMREGGAN
jgi:catechol 2,3-dioxygenase-like lactoylglutathione lyase family enzyme